ncbi:DUF2971 domain-containing protein [Methylibium sp. T29]|uniref:DUF2971 domain-containing protein n=1 Tax=Methylibium sp. T29 TaxID=1430884 RepID=UPI0003F4085F|nr:DUF2971 domain-containing protein [Methylibium sp. T29]EWS53016.1 hypothetical protein X551_04194 [Methylibium sp. T29]EWS57605.1 hypothetical protein Y694_04418 [Methylibium sp. T29-B]
MRTFRNTIFPDLKCPDHGVYDVWPCPWPSCKNGIPEDSFQVDPLVEGEEPEVYSRREWRTVAREPYYSWDGTKLPNWFTVQKVAWNEARRLGMVDSAQPELIYHYTGVEAFFGIVQSGNLWLSDYSYLNDTRELSHGADLIAEVATEFLSQESRPKAGELLQHWIKALAAPVHRVCVASFSAAGDSLSQWRAYGPIAIGFEPRDVSLHAYRANLRPVEYLRERQRALVEVHLHHTREAYLRDLHEGRLERIEDAYYKIDRLIELIAFFKDPAFEQEQEYRLAFIEHPDLMPSLGHKSSAKRFRVGRGRIIPYVLSNELEPVLPDGRALALREVVLGPEADATLERGIREFLAESNMSEVKVKLSRVPYRT